MASVMRFDEWQDSNGVPVLDGANLAVPSSALPAGSILQVVSTTKTDTFTTTSQSYTPVTGLSASITPSSTSSKIMIFVTMGIGFSSGANSVNWRISGGNATSYIGDAGSGQAQVITAEQNYDDGSLVTYAGNYLDSPSTTSSTTYQVEIHQTGTGVSCFVNRSRTDGAGLNYGRGASTITVMEVAA